MQYNPSCHHQLGPEYSINSKVILCRQGNDDVTLAPVCDNQRAMMSYLVVTDHPAPDRSTGTTKLALPLTLVPPCIAHAQLRQSYSMVALGSMEKNRFASVRPNQSNDYDAVLHHPVTGSVCKRGYRIPTGFPRRFSDLPLLSIMNSHMALHASTMAPQGSICQV